MQSYSISATTLQNALGISACNDKSKNFRRLRMRASNANAEVTSEEYNLDGGPVLKVKKGVPRDGGHPYIELQVSNYNSPSLLLHWGALKGDNRKWTLPSKRPPGTRDFHNSALQSPFGESGTLKIEVSDQDYSAIEFLLRDDASDRWIKLNGNNLHVEVPHSRDVLPKDLVDLNAYLRWEQKGKQNYTVEQETREYEEARKELQEELDKGATVESIRARLLGGGNQATSSESKTRKSRLHKISRKKWDFSELFSKHSKVEDNFKFTKEPSALELVSESVVQGAEVIYKKIFKLGKHEVLVIASSVGEDNRVFIATNFEEPMVLRWSLSEQNAREWKSPPENVLPRGSEAAENAVETPFSRGFAENSEILTVQIDLGHHSPIGMPFVLRTGSNWIKLDGSDFYIPLQKPASSKIKVELDATGTAKWLLDEIASLETEAQRSLMHRYNIAADLLDRAKSGGELVIAGFLVWLRYMAMRQLTWNKNYNVKPREISAAQDRLTNVLQTMFLEQPQNRELIRLTLSTVGRGAEGDVGQRIRDEILVIQRNNDCKGGMMEEWHQKLHNNTSPDDVVICQALLDYIQTGFNIDEYWKTLNANGVTKQRLASYDRPIVSEPRFRPEQKDGLIRDLTSYMRTLKAVHSGADLESAIATCMGYSAQGHDFMGSFDIHPISGLSKDLPEILSFVLAHVEDKGRDVFPLLEGLLEARRELASSLKKPHDRLKDIIFLDLALDSTVRTAVERGFEELKTASDIIQTINLVLENLCLSSDQNEELVYCFKDWQRMQQISQSGAEDWPLQAKAVLDRTRLALSDKAERYQEILQPTAVYLGRLLGVENWAMDIFTEEMIRAGSAASLSLLLNRLDPELRSMANLGSWQVISPVNAKGFISVVDDLGKVQEKVYERPTVLISRRVKGEEEIPDGAVALLTPDMPDVLSHVSVRARNSKVLFATCFDPKILNELSSWDGNAVSLQITPSSDITFTKIDSLEVMETDGTELGNAEHSRQIVLKSKTFLGKFAVSADEFTSDMVGAKSLNTVRIRGKLPPWIKLPSSAALPFGVFENVLSNDLNKDIALEIAQLKNGLISGDLRKLKEIRETVLRLKAPTGLVNELKSTMLKSGIPWPSNKGGDRWEQAWTSIKRVWASKWNERAYISTRKAKIDHEQLRMAVLVQEIVCADYAFVIHTSNPSNGDSSEIYAEVVKGLGETLVGAYSGRAMSFSAPKSDLRNVKIIGYPSKRVGLFIKPSIIFRSDSNGEDLEGYAGAGLYDSVPMDKEEELIVDYTADRLLHDKDFQQSILTKIAVAGSEIEQIYGSPQDIEGCIKEGEVYIVQTRPQM